jgi:cytosine deaminase
VETHIHLDKSRILDRCTPPPVGVRDYMQRVADVKPTFTVEDVYNRARDTLEQCLLHGATLMRTHVEVDPNVGLTGFEALKQLAADYRWAIDIEFCVFAQEGWTNAPETDANVVAALGDGATVVGAPPASTRIMAARSTGSSSWPGNSMSTWISISTPAPPLMIWTFTRSAG